MAAPKLTLTPEQFRQRCIELAESHHMLHTARLVEQSESEKIFSCPSEARDGCYTIRIKRDGSSDCTCKSYGACKHRGACYVACDLMAEAQRPRTAAEVERENMWTQYWAAAED